MTDIIFSFDTEDFTSNEAADTIYREAEILRSEGVKGGFCIVGLLASQLMRWGRQDVIDALKHHDILTHSYGHSLHPTINEYTDTEDFGVAYSEFINQETEGVRLIKELTEEMDIYGACPPGNQKSYVAMYGYADMGLPIYADTVCDTTDGRGVFYCNIFHTSYTFLLENFLLERSDEEYMKQALDTLAKNKRAIIYTHPHCAIYTRHWDAINYYQVNKHPFGEWEKAPRRSPEETEQFYDSIKRFIQMIKEDGRFNITSYSELAKKLKNEPERDIRKSDIHYIREQLCKNFATIEKTSYSIADVFLACKDILCGEEKHTCGKVYGFLKTPYAVKNKVVLSKEDIVLAAKEMDTKKFLPTKIRAGNEWIGPADWLRAAMDVICGAEEAVVMPDIQLPCFDTMPALRDVSFRGKWVMSDEFEDKYLSDRLRLQIWTMRFLQE
ncbi:MAG: hypothetical protein E7441_12045 [Ruminococcaceae bacterium]|nr:hypothetical protein [Oscillospiraceae bacterium]